MGPVTALAGVCLQDVERGAHEGGKRPLVSRLRPVSSKATHPPTYLPLHRMPQRGVAQRQAVPLAAPAAPPRAPAPAASPCGPSPRGTAFSHAVPRGSAPHLRRSGRRGGRRSSHVWRGWRRAGRPRPSFCAAAVWSWRQHGSPTGGIAVGWPPSAAHILPCSARGGCRGALNGGRRATATAERFASPSGGL